MGTSCEAWADEDSFPTKDQHSPSKRTGSPFHHVMTSASKAIQHRIFWNVGGVLRTLPQVTGPRLSSFLSEQAVPSILCCYPAEQWEHLETDYSPPTCGQQGNGKTGGGFLGGTNGKEPICQSRRLKRRGFNPQVGKLPRRRKWQPTLVFLPRESHGQRSLVG